MIERTSKKISKYKNQIKKTENEEKTENEGSNEEKLNDLEIKDKRRKQVNKLIDSTKKIHEEKLRFIQGFRDFFNILDYWVQRREEIQEKMKRFIDSIDLVVEEINRKEQDFRQINNLIQMVRVIIEKENSYIKR